jgi:hypothetical protein
MKKELPFQSLENYLARVPAIVQPFGTGIDDDGSWWIKFSIDIGNPLAWNVVQELGHVLNYLSINEKLPTSFFPISPPPYMNGGPQEFLSWVVECSDSEFTPGMAVEWLEGRLPQPVDDLAKWNLDK